MGAGKTLTTTRFWFRGQREPFGVTNQQFYMGGALPDWSIEFGSLSRYIFRGLAAIPIGLALVPANSCGGL